ncbi:MAG: thermonuclease family protein [Pseudomonadota bacterium]
MLKPSLAPLICVLLALALLIPGAAAQTIETAGPARIVDGDTIEIGHQAIRIHGIDAAETGQQCQLPKGTWDCATAAMNALAKMTAGRTVQCVGHEFDDYGRLIARCRTEAEHDIGAKLVASGLAWAFVKYSADYIDLEMKPRRQKVGIWQSKTQPPWEYRARRWETAAQIAPTKDCPIKGNISAKGERIYHAPWSKHYARTRVEPAKGERWFCTEAEAIAAGWRAPYR